jgi:hypothetical protein
VLEIAKIDHERVFVMPVFVMLLQELQVQQVQDFAQQVQDFAQQVQDFAQLVLVLQLLQLLVLVERHHVAHQQLVHLLKMQLLKSYPQNYLMGYKF